MHLLAHRFQRRAQRAPCQLVIIGIPHRKASAHLARPVEEATGDEAVAVQAQVCGHGGVGLVEEREDGGAGDGGFERRDYVGSTAGCAVDHGADDAFDGFGAGGESGKDAAR